MCLMLLREGFSVEIRPDFLHVMDNPGANKCRNKAVFKAYPALPKQK